MWHTVKRARGPRHEAEPLGDEVVEAVAVAWTDPNEHALGPDFIGEGDSRMAVCAVTRPDGTVCERRFSVADAKNAGLWGKQGPWKQYPDRMLAMRARGFAARDGAADVLGGLYLSEELQDTPAEPRDIVLNDLARERRRQVEVEGWTAEHDDQHANGEMAMAAAAYAYSGTLEGDQRRIDANLFEINSALSKILWPWSREWWKPKDPRRDLVRAGALIIAEIARLDRAGQSHG